MAIALGDVLVRAVMYNASGLPEDAVVNTFAFMLGESPTDALFDDVMDLVDEFYRTPTADGAAVGAFISSSVNRSATHLLQGYAIASDGSTGSPFYERDWIGPPGVLGGSNLPNESAAVLSFHGDLTGIPEEAGTQRPKARRRGRVYIGPLRNEAIDGTVPNPPLSSAIRISMPQAAVRLMDNSQTAGTPWAVFSRAALSLYQVVGGWMDNSPDSQRRRGQAPTIRAAWG